MRKLLLSGVASLAFGVTAAAAADMAVKAERFLSPVSVARWDGLYVGAHLGAEWGHFFGDALFAGPNGTGGGIRAGGQIGYNFQFGRTVLGIEADGSWMDVTASWANGSFKENWRTSLRGRVGYVVDRYLAYLTLGVAWTGVDGTLVLPAVGGSNTATGFTVGGGVETWIAPRWSGRVEAFYAHVPMQTFGAGVVQMRGGSHNYSVRAGLNYFPFR